MIDDLLKIEKTANIEPAKRWKNRYFFPDGGVLWGEKIHTSYDVAETSTQDCFKLNGCGRNKCIPTKGCLYHHGIVDYDKPYPVED